METVVRYYDVCERDFAAWSPSLYLHFGLYRRGLSPFDRESMLTAMNDAVIARLAPRPGAHVLDAGCGVGAVARYLARRHPHVTVTGVTIVPSQVALGRTLVARDGLASRVTLLESDYGATPFAAGQLDGAYAIESLCYAEGDAKEPAVAEMARVLGPGGRFVVADCFRTSAEVPRALRSSYDAMCSAWAIPSLPHLPSLTRALRAHGFRSVEVEDVSWRVAPSVAHVPFTVTKYLARHFWTAGRSPLPPERRSNLVAPLLGAFLGASRTHFRYCLVTAIKN